MADPNFQKLPTETKDRFRKMIEMDRLEKEKKKKDKEMERKRIKEKRRQKNEDRRQQIAQKLYGGNN